MSNSITLFSVTGTCLSISNSMKLRVTLTLVTGLLTTAMRFLTGKNWSLKLLLIILLFADSTFAQQFNFLHSIPVKAMAFETDQLKNVYLLDSSGTVTKYSGNTDSIYSFNETKFGAPALIDASKPFKLLLFYPDQQHIKLLDKTMSEIGSINLLQLGFQNVNVVCSSADANIWLYDEINFKLKKLDDQLNVVMESEDMNQIIGESIRPEFIIENEGTVYLSDPLKGIFVFDRYATYIKTIPIKNLFSFQLISDQLIYFFDNKLHIFNLKTLITQDIELPLIENIIGAELQKDRLYILQKDQLSLYGF